MAGLIALAIVIWFSMQFLPSRSKKWVRRGKAIEPLLVHFGRDVNATVEMVRTHFQRKRLIELGKHDRAMAVLFHGRES